MKAKRNSDIGLKIHWISIGFCFSLGPDKWAPIWLMEKKNNNNEEPSAYLLCQGQGAGVGDGGGSIGHRTHHGHASCQSSCRPRGEVLLVCGTGLPQVNMHVDQPWGSLCKMLDFWTNTLFNGMYTVIYNSYPDFGLIRVLTWWWRHHSNKY